MAVGKLFNLFALSSLAAVIVCNLGATPVNALAFDNHHMAGVKRAHGAHAAEGVAKRRRDSSQRCKPRTASSSASPASSTSSWSTTSPSPTSTPQSTWSSTAAPSSTSASSSSSPSSSSNGSKKLGIAWPNGNSDELNSVVSSDTGYIYTWSEQCPSLSKSLGLACMPMLWGGDSSRLSAWKSTVMDVTGYASIALGFNEPNEAGQSNMDVGTAVSLWYQYMEPLVSQGYKLVAPATSSAPSGLTWVQQFFEQCSGCHIDAIALHYYGTSPQDMISYIENWYNTFKLPMYVTEYACQNYDTAYENNGQQCSEDQVWDFHKTVVDYMEGNSNVVVYAPFGFMLDMQGVNTLNQLMTSSGPTDLGKAYLYGFS